jgi:hypothetical protein
MLFPFEITIKMRMRNTWGVMLSVLLFIGCKGQNHNLNQQLINQRFKIESIVVNGEDLTSEMRSSSLIFLENMVVLPWWRNKKSSGSFVYDQWRIVTENGDELLVIEDVRFGVLSGKYKVKPHENLKEEKPYLISFTTDSILILAYKPQLVPGGF